ncbi:hypothetical protein I0C86_41485 [Plantactinospora sp. S1510]|uniref:HMG box domain-containing protein n=1 Tax=Plantactinospora alkalitolerans TaxID=2789879 RepID=A0ABS0HA29_9ACTN|nr:hypothetical protein [Plantactinospora alkalitolerans]MBF9135326.1 hypothetical protein [Plantactinospora alkalitolerans]
MPQKPQKFEFETYFREHPVTGEQQERTPDTPSQEVNLIADGWRKKPKATKSTPPTKSTGGSSS